MGQAEEPSQTLLKLLPGPVRSGLSPQAQGFQTRPPEPTLSRTHSSSHGRALRSARRLRLPSLRRCVTSRTCVFTVQVLQNVPIWHLPWAGGVQVVSGGGRSQPCFLSGETEARGRKWAGPAVTAGLVSLPPSAAFPLFPAPDQSPKPPCLPAGCPPAPPGRARRTVMDLGQPSFSFRGLASQQALPPSPRLLQTDDKRECL